MNTNDQLAYELLDRFLRNILDDEDYKTYNLALEVVLAAQPAAIKRNQCDGCQAGKPLENGNRHRMGRDGGYPDFIRCTASRYKDEQPAAVEPVGYCEPSNIQRMQNGEITGFLVHENAGGPIPMALFANPPRDVAAGGAVLPGRLLHGMGYAVDFVNGWNACVDETEMLNGITKP